MKKDSVLKALGITFLVMVLLSWVIPAGIYSYGVFTKTDATVPIGLYDFIRIPVLTIATFIQYGILFLAIGGFYGVLNKTGVYSNIVNSISKKWEGSKKKFLVITVCLFTILTSLSGLTDVMFILVPFFIAVLLKLGYNKLVSLSSTVGAIMVGNLASTFGFNTWGYLQGYLDLSMTSLIGARAILLVMALLLLILYLFKSTKDLGDKKSKKKIKDDKNEDILIPLYEDTKSKKSNLPLIVISILLFVFLVIASYNWKGAFEIEVFSNLYDNINSFKVGKYEIFHDLLAMDNVPVLGEFVNYDISIILIFASLIIGWIYSLKTKETVESFAKGAKEMLIPATYSMLACVAFACMLNMPSDGGNFVNTIMSKFIDTEKFTLFGTVGTSLVSGFVYNDIATLLGRIVNLFVAYDTNVIPIVAFIIQGMFGILCLIAPTSIYLVVGLSITDVSYKEWVKFIWKYVLILFIIIVFVAFILTTLL